MPNHRQILLQETNEQRFNRKHIDGYIREDIEASEQIQKQINEGVDLLEQYRSTEYSYESKNKRVAQLADIDLRELVENIFVGIAYFRREELFSSVVPQMAGRLNFSDRVEAATTMAEMLAVLADTDAFDITKEDKLASLMLVSRLPLSDRTIEFIDRSAYLPPMVCEPLELRSNYDSGYLTHRDSLVLGHGNHHEGDLCLDVLNLMNKVPLKLCTEFLSTVEEAPTFDLVTPEQIDQWVDFMRQSYYFYSLLVNQGNRFYMTHKPDKRGRIYSQGYHINPQGTAFKRAMLELADGEIVEGVP